MSLLLKMMAVMDVLICTVGLGSDRTEFDADISVPYDSRAGFRLNHGNGQQQSGNSPSGGGAITSWTSDGAVHAPNTCSHNLFEISWVEVSSSGAFTKISPFAASSFNTWDGTKTWEARTTTAGLKDWIIDVTVREIADTGNTDTVRYTMLVEGVV